MKIKMIQIIQNQNEKKKICEKILRSLPNWFGIESAILNYIKECSGLPFWAFYQKQNPIGFVCLKPHHQNHAEVFVMGILDEHQNQGIGTDFMKKVEEYCKKEKIKYLSVKTVSDESPDPYYKITRNFYRKCGFRDFETLPTLWDKHNPCLILLKNLD